MSHSGPAQTTLHAQVRRSQARRRLFTPGAPLVVAVSGGADSVCLLHILHDLAAEWQLALHVAHVDHALRPASAADAAFVAALAAQLGLPYHGTRLVAGSLAGQPGGVELAARRARYAFLFRTAAAVSPPGCLPTVALAHHAGDQAETLLLHLARGSGLRGLAGMRPYSRVRAADIATDIAADDAQAAEPLLPAEAALVRPLLDVDQAAIYAWLTARGASWREDETNSLLAPARNRLRHQVLPALAELNPQVTLALARTAEILAAEADRAEAADAAALAAALVHSDAERIVLDLAALRRQHPAAQRGALRQALACLDRMLDDIAFAQVEELVAEALPAGRSRGPHPLAHGLAWTRLAAPPRLSLHRAAAQPLAPAVPQLAPGRPPTPIPLPGVLFLDGGWRLRAELLPAAQLSGWRRAGPWQAWLDADAVPEPALAPPRPGLRIAPLGLGGHSKSVGDLFTDRKTPLAQRAGWPLILDGVGAVAWVCGLAVAHSAAITAATQRVLRLTWERTEPAAGGGAEEPRAEQGTEQTEQEQA